MSLGRLCPDGGSGRDGHAGDAGHGSRSRQMPFAVSASDGISRLCRLCCTLLTCPRPGNLHVLLLSLLLSLFFFSSSSVCLLLLLLCRLCLGPFVVVVVVVVCNLSLVLVLVIVAVVVLVIIVIIAICCCRLWGCCCCCFCGDCKGVDGRERERESVEWQVASGESRVVASKMLLLQCKPKTAEQTN